MLAGRCLWRTVFLACKRLLSCCDFTEKGKQKRILVSLLARTPSLVDQIPVLLTPFNLVSFWALFPNTVTSGIQRNTIPSILGGYDLIMTFMHMQMNCYLAGLLLHYSPSTSCPFPPIVRLSRPGQVLACDFNLIALGNPQPTQRISALWGHQGELLPGSIYAPWATPPHPPPKIKGVDSHLAGNVIQETTG